MIGVFEEVGATIMANACGPCIGQWKRVTDDPVRKNSIVTSFNRNFAKRADGNPNTYAFVASPELTMALTIAGDLCFNPLKDTLISADGKKVKLSEPVGEELPPKGFYGRQRGIYRAFRCKGGHCGGSPVATLATAHPVSCLEWGGFAKYAFAD